MGVLYVQASFKNSRLKSRAPTSEANTFLVAAPIGTSKLLDADITRTYVTIRNKAAADSIQYDYAEAGAGPPNFVDGAMTLEHGEAADLESPQEIWVKNDSAAAIDVEIDQGKG